MEEKKTSKRTPYQRSRRIQAQCLGWLLTLSMGLVLVLSLLLPDSPESAREGRSLARFPKAADVLDGTVFTDLGDWFADQFPGRDLWLSLDLMADRILGRRDVGGVYLCQDGSLLAVPAASDGISAEANLAAVNAFGAGHPDLNLVVSVVPGATAILGDKLPANAPVPDQKAGLEAVRNGLTAGTFADVTPILETYRNEYLFYKTDSHWTSMGAYRAFTGLAPFLQLQYPGTDGYQIYPVSTTFQGDLASRSGSAGTTDTVEIFAAEAGVEYYVTYEDTGKTVSSLYSRAALNGSDHYAVFFGGDHARVDITTTASTGRSLLLIKDAWANAMVQFLYPYFDHITMIDPRYYYENLELVIKSESVTDVLLLCSLDTWQTDNALAQMLASE